MFLKRLFFLLFIILSKKIIAQYVVNGNAFSTSCNCYTITQPINTQSGSVWNSNQINLLQPFDFKYDVFLGCADANGADGMVFILQPISTSVGSSGGGMGFQGVSPSVGIVMDTYQNTGDNDPTYDHISINLNGNINHNAATNLAGPIQIISGNDNAEDCSFHVLRVTWDPVTKIITVYIDGLLRVTATIDLINTVFSGNPNVYWGFTAATGGLNNEQKFCTRLNTQIVNTASSDTFCFPATVNLNSNVDAFGPVAQYYWNMGDGTTYSTNNITHNYTAPGTYVVKNTIKGIDGCTSDTAVKTIIIGNAPSVSVNVSDYCQGQDITLNAAISLPVFVGNITDYIWTLDNATVPNSNSVSVNVGQLPAGQHIASLQLKTNYGCFTNLSIDTFIVFTKPTTPTFATQNVCSGTTTNLTPTNIDNSLQYYWIINNATPINSNTINNIYAVGNYTVKLFVKNSNGCSSDTTTQTFSVLQIPTASIIVNDTCSPSPIILQGNAANAMYSQQWLVNNAQVATTTNYTNVFAAGNYNVQYIVNNTALCADTATASFTIYPKPTAPTFAVQNACSGISTTLTPTIIDNNLQYYWIINNGASVNSTSITNSYSLGNYYVKLFTKNSNGCVSDTAYGNFTITQKPTALIIVNDTCAGFATTLLTSAANAGFTHQWLVNNAQVATTASFTNLFTAGNYNVTYIVQNSPQCADTATAFFTVNKKPDISVSATTVCLGQSTQFTTTINNAPLTIQNYQWLFHDGTTSALMNPSKLFASEGSFNAKMIATTINGCKSDTLNTLFVISKASVFAGNDTIVLRNQPFSLNAIGSIGNYMWQPSLPFTNANVYNPSGVLNNDQQFVVRVASAEGCIATDTILIKVFDGGRIYVPTAFSPNNDGQNDVLLPLYVGIKKLDYFKIFNRWGQVVFNTQNQNFGWSGNLQNKLQPTGTYVFVVSGVDYLGNPFFQKGTVMVLR